MNVRYLLIFLALALFTFGCSNNNGLIGGSGLIEADEILISSNVSGQVITLKFDEGSMVNANDTLLVIDPTKLELQLKSARAGYEVASSQLRAARIQKDQAEKAANFNQSERDRVSRLAQSGSATQKQLDQMEYEFSQAVLTKDAASAMIATAQADVDKWSADIERIERELKDCYPQAPLTGVVLEKLVDRGELLAPTKPIARIANLDSVWVKIYLSSGGFAKVKLGDNATVDTESGGTKYTGTVIWTSQEAEFTPKNVQTKNSRADLVYAVKIKIPNSDKLLKIGMPVYVTIGS